MSDNRDKIFERYSNSPEDGRAESSRSNSLEFHYTKKLLEGLITKDSRVIEVGCATGYYGMYYADKCREYMGVDIFEPHIEIFRRRIEEAGLKNVSAAVGDAIDLSGIEDESFDVVLCFGPMYHLSPKERAKAFAECYRVCRKGGLSAFAYINNIGAYAGACVIAPLEYPNERANEYVLERLTDDVWTDLFYYTTPEQMEAEAAEFGFEKVKNLGIRFMFLSNIVDGMSDEQFEIMRPLYDKMTAHESCVGMADHGALICRKK